MTNSIWEAYNNLIDHPIPGAHTPNGTHGPEWRRYRLMLAIEYHRAIIAETPNVALMWNSEEKLAYAEAQLALLDQPGNAYWQSLLLDTYTKLAELDAQNEAGKAHQAMLDVVHPPHEVKPNHRHDVMGGDPESGIVFD